MASGKPATLFLRQNYLLMDAVERDRAQTCVIVRF